MLPDTIKMFIFIWIVKYFTIYDQYCKEYNTDGSSYNIYVYSLNLNQSNFLLLNQWFAFLLIHQSRRYNSLLNQLILTDSLKKILLFNQLIFTEEISEIGLIRSNLFLAIQISQISLITSVKINWFNSEIYICHRWKSKSLIQSVKKIYFNVKSLNFHWFAREKIFFTVKSVNFHWSNQWNWTDSQKPFFSYLNQLNLTDYFSKN